MTVNKQTNKREKGVFNQPFDREKYVIYDR